MAIQETARLYTSLHNLTRLGQEPCSSTFGDRSRGSIDAITQAYIRLLNQSSSIEREMGTLLELMPTQTHGETYTSFRNTKGWKNLTNIGAFGDIELWGSSDYYQQHFDVYPMCLITSEKSVVVPFMMPLVAVVRNSLMQVAETYIGRVTQAIRAFSFPITVKLEDSNGYSHTQRKSIYQWAGNIRNLLENRLSAGNWMDTIKTGSDNDLSNPIPARDIVNRELLIFNPGPIQLSYLYQKFFTGIEVSINIASNGISSSRRESYRISCLGSELTVDKFLQILRYALGYYVITNSLPSIIKAIPSVSSGATDKDIRIYLSAMVAYLVSLQALINPRSLTVEIE